jgi:YVTN family beta-propeller protein
MCLREMVTGRRMCAPSLAPIARVASASLASILVFACTSPSKQASVSSAPNAAEVRRLPTGAALDPAGDNSDLGSMPLSLVVAPDGAHAVALLGGWREQGIQIIDTKTGRVTQTLLQPAAFVGLVFSVDGKTLFVSGGNQDVVYEYSWNAGTASLSDSIILENKAPRASGTRYPAGLAVSSDGHTLFVAENLSDSLAVVDVASRRVVQRLPTERYPYGVAAGSDGTVYVSAWGGNTVSIFSRDPHGSYTASERLRVLRHPSALLLNRDGSRLFVVSGSTDRVAIVDTKSRAVVDTIVDTVPGGTGEGSTPNALALSVNGTRLFIAEADNNAVAIVDLSAKSSGGAATADANHLVGRVPVGWYPTAVAVTENQLLVANGKGRGTAPNPDGPTPTSARTSKSRSYTLGQTSGTLSRVPLTNLSAAELLAQSTRVAALNGWRSADARAEASRARARKSYPPFEHVIYVIKENRTYDQLFGDLPIGDGDSTLLFFPRHVSPNHHALAERFGVFDRFFVNAEVSPDGHNWSTAAYVSDYAEKTIPSNYSNRGRTYDYEGTNRGFAVENIPSDDVNEPAAGYLWDLANRAHISFRNYGEFVVGRVAKSTTSGVGRADTTYVGTKPFLRAHTNEHYPGFNLEIQDQRRIAIWLDEFASDVAKGTLPALEIVRLPNDHTMGAAGGKPTPWAFMADNDLALGRLVEAVSASPYWRNTVIFVVEDDAQNGPDHVDSHRAPVLIISAYNHGGLYHRWTNTTDVISTIGDILKLGRLSQFDAYGRSLSDVFAATADTSHYRALSPDVALDAKNLPQTSEARASERLDFRREDLADEDSFNRILWRVIKGREVQYPGPRRMSALEWRRSR